MGHSYPGLHRAHPLASHGTDALEDVDGALDPASLHQCVKADEGPCPAHPGAVANTHIYIYVMSYNVTS